MIKHLISVSLSALGVTVVQAPARCDLWPASTSFLPKTISAGRRGLCGDINKYIHTYDIIELSCFLMRDLWIVIERMGEIKKKIAKMPFSCVDVWVFYS